MWLNNTVSRRKRYRVYLRLYLPRPLHLTSPRPRPTRPRVPYVPASHTSRVPYQMSPRPSPRVPKSQVPTHASQCPRPLVPVPVLHTTFLSLGLSNPVTFTDIFICKRLENKRDLGAQVKSFRHCSQFMPGFSDSETGSMQRNKVFDNSRVINKRSRSSFVHRSTLYESFPKILYTFFTSYQNYKWKL